MSILTCHEMAVEAATLINETIPQFPPVAVVLGSGMGARSLTG